MEKENPNIEQYIRYYQGLLEQKGYNEASLKNGEPAGTIASNIEKAFKDLSEKFGNEKDPYCAVLCTTGNPLPEGGLMQFEFVFTYDQAKKAIQMEALNISQIDLSMQIIPKVKGGIPHLKEALGIIRKERLQKLGLIPKPQQKNDRGNRFNLN
jgi:hypothetical protein